MIRVRLFVVLHQFEREAARLLNNMDSEGKLGVRRGKGHIPVVSAMMVLRCTTRASILFLNQGYAC
jgi:hypothetical protein